MTDNVRQFLAPRPQRRVLQLVMLRDPLNALVSLFHYQHMNQPLSHAIPNPRLAVKFFQKYAATYLKYWAPYSYPGTVCDRCVCAATYGAPRYRSFMFPVSASRTRSGGWPCQADKSAVATVLK
jgi:hypothetical protein